MNQLSHPGFGRTVAGILVLLMLLLTIGGALLEPIWPNHFLLLAGGAGWLAAVILVRDLSRMQQIQVGLLLLVGVLLVVYGVKAGAEIDIEGIISGNTALLTMVTAVGFLRLVALPTSVGERKLPVGRRAYLNTLLGTSLFGSVINLSGPLLIADRIDQQSPLQRFTSQSITRVFSACASWSPFFAGMAVVLTYVSDAKLLFIMLAGLPFAIVSFAVVYTEARYRYSDAMESFTGYPIKLESLWIPSLLAICVVLGSKLFPALPILIVISLSALVITILVLIFREGLRNGLTQIREHIFKGLPRIINELALFLAAGVLAVGIAALIQTGVLITPVSHFNAFTAIQLLGIMILIAAMGVHPVIQISGFTPLLLTLNPDPNLLAMTYLFAWSLGTSASPLSGTHLVFQGRYGIPSWKAAMWNWPYVVVMYGFGAGWLFVASRYFL